MTAAFPLVEFPRKSPKFYLREPIAFEISVSLGAVVPVIDEAHTLNGLPGKSATGGFGAPTWASSTGEGIMPGTKMEYENEFVLGIQREITHGSVLSIRYSDRRLGRIVEDIGSESVEGSLVDQFYNGGIANVTAGTDISVNEDEVTYTPDQWYAANQVAPGQIAELPPAAVAA